MILLSLNFDGFRRLLCGSGKNLFFLLRDDDFLSIDDLTHDLVRNFASEKLRFLKGNES